MWSDLKEKECRRRVVNAERQRRRRKRRRREEEATAYSKNLEIWVAKEMTLACFILP
jgi:hypothetical protein